MSTDSGEAKLHFLDYWRVLRVRMPLVILVFLLVVITAAVVTYLMPRQYASTVTMQIRQNDTYVRVFNDSGVQNFDPRFIATQFAILEHKEMLYPIIDSLGLVDRWKVPSKEMAYYRLIGMITPQDIRNTELIKITVLSGNNKEAAEIANAIAEEYQRRRIEEQTRWVSRSLTTLEEEVQKQKIKVQELKSAAAKLRVEKGISDLNPEGMEDSISLEGEGLRAIDQQVNAEELRVASLRAKHEQVSQMTDEQIMNSLATLEILDPIISQVLPLYKELSSEEARLLNSGIGPNHPDAKSIRAKKLVMERQLADQTKSLRKSLEVNLKIAEEGLKNLQARLAASKSEQQSAKTESSEYYEAKNEYVMAKKLLEAAELKLKTEKMDTEMPKNPAVIWEKAEPSQYPSRPNVPLNIALGIGVGLVLGVGLAFFIEYLDTSVKTMEDVESFLQVPVLAVIPKNISLLINESPDNPDAEAYRIMRTNIEFNRKNPEASTITIVSGGTGEGKSTTMANIAYTFAQGGYSTLIVDADLRRPSQYRIFGVSNDVGLTDYLTSDIELEEVVLQTKIDNLFLLPSGRIPADAVGILNSQRMVEFIEEVKSRFDIIFFDSPPILGVSDASVLASAIDLTVIVVQHRRFPRAMLQRVKQAVVNVGGNILGVVLNNVDVRHDQHYEYYTSYYNYYYQKPNKEPKKAQKKHVAVAQNKDEEKNEETY